MYKAYNKGFIDGLKAFAHWKNGIEYIGTCGTELKDIVEAIEKIWSYEPITDRLEEENNDRQTKD